ncbi:3-oxoadipate enol-lactonase [Nonomuraea sp. NPDC050556]|uniref:bifunctional 3-oxoadipate enol-lactonase/4-carboxymuconolactone decarboxylase PcaDC n=1 Tax=Nonomuraea sp. NPDC050556 TaxID=3364369 RepID=UPI0037AC72E8
MLDHRVDGPDHAPPLLLGPSLGTTHALWDAQVPALARRHRVIRWNLPGHGGTPATRVTDVGDLGRLVLELADSLGVERFSYAGVSLGGAVGAWLAAHGERVERLALVCSSARFGEPQGWHERAALVREHGVGPVADTAATRWFTPGFTGGEPFVAAMRTVDPAGYAACCDALSTFDLRDDLERITAPTVVIAGREDPSTPVAHARQLADGIPGASLVEIPHAAHLALVEQPERVTAALREHFEGAAGMRVRREVLGDEHVDRAIARTTPFTADFQDLITRYAWGEIWTRPGLDRKTRSCVTLTALIARGHHEELAMHVRAALRNGLTPDEIKEVILQSAIYCGVPAANSAFAVADRVINP